MHDKINLSFLCCNYDIKSVLSWPFLYPAVFSDNECVSSVSSIFNIILWRRLFACNQFHFCCKSWGKIVIYKLKVELRIYTFRPKLKGELNARVVTFHLNRNFINRSSKLKGGWTKEKIFVILTKDFCWKRYVQGVFQIQYL